ncbi:hypothetical protein JKP88DRAFT_143971, partial [Tribonema minus]
VLSGKYRGKAYDDSPASLPGVLQLWRFDQGGAEIAFHTGGSSAQGLTSAFRQFEDKVQLPIYIEIVDGAGGAVAAGAVAQKGMAVSMLSSGDWLRFTVDVSSDAVLIPTWQIATVPPAGTRSVNIRTKIVVDSGSEAKPCQLQGAGGLDLTTPGSAALASYVGGAITLAQGQKQVLTICMQDVTNFKIASITFNEVKTSVI